MYHKADLFEKDRILKLFRYLIIAGVMSVALECSIAAQTVSMGLLKVPPMPANLQVPTGNHVFLSGHAEGIQNYVCLPSLGSFQWTFFSPQATLSLDFKLGSLDVQQQIITHFLSPNPVEGGTERATWQSSIDTSAVWAKVATNGSSIDAGFVAFGAIPWLKLEVVGTRGGPNGGDILAHTTFVQRLNTSGGIAPLSGCSQAQDVGATALVPYTADYFFYNATHAR